MIEQSLAAEVAIRWQVSDRTEKAVDDFVSRLTTLTEPTQRPSERRRETRTPFPHLLTLTPIDDHQLRVIGEPICVVGKQLASRGLDFYHTQTLTFKRAIVSFENDLGLADAHCVLSLSWCRFLRPGWYDGGGRFTHVVAQSLDGAEEFLAD